MVICVVVFENDGVKITPVFNLVENAGYSVVSVELDC